MLLAGSVSFFFSFLFFFFFLRDPEMVYHPDYDYGKVQVSYSSFDLISFLPNFSFDMVIKATSPISINTSVTRGYFKFKSLV